MKLLTSFVGSVRVVFAIVTAVTILFCTTSLVLFLSPLALLQRVGIQNPVPFVCGWGFRIFDLVSLRLCLDLYVQHRDGTGICAVHKARKREVLVIIANHPSLAVIFATPSLVWDLGLRGCAAVIKAEFITKWYLAWLGIPATLAGFALPIRREQRNAALQALKKGVCRLPFGKRPFGIIIFPDGTRPTHNKISASWTRYVKQTDNPRGYSAFTQTLVPKALGLSQLLKQLHEAEHEIRVIDLTIGLSRPMPHTLWGDLTAMNGATLIVHRADITGQIRACRSLDELTILLMDRWSEKNRKIKEWAERSS